MILVGFSCMATMEVVSKSEERFHSFRSGISRHGSAHPFAHSFSRSEVMGSIPHLEP